MKDAPEVAFNLQAELLAAQSELAALREELASVCSMACMLEDREWAEHAGKGPVAEKLESAITELHNELSSTQQALTAAEQRNSELVELRRERDTAEKRKAELESAVCCMLDGSRADAEPGEITIMRADYEALAELIDEPAESGAS